MKNFSEFGITTTNKGLKGEKIKIDRVLNRQVTIRGYQIVDSKFEGKGKRLDLEIEVDKADRVIFTGSVVLMDMIAQVPKEEFPFQATIVKENDRYEFR
jgi:hypothetical protein